jgi:hypothetical protein
MNIEISRHLWKPFCEKLNSLRGTLLDIRTQTSGGGEMQYVTQAASLHSVTFDESDLYNVTLTVEFTMIDLGPSEHRILEPVRLVLRNDTEGDHYNILEIPAEAGISVIIFHPGIGPLLLDEAGIALPESSPLARAA